jgi:hypothetical protein
MKGQDRVDRWRAARERVFDNRHLERASLT